MELEALPVNTMRKGILEEPLQSILRETHRIPERSEILLSVRIRVGEADDGASVAVDDDLARRFEFVRVEFCQGQHAIV